MAHLRSEHHTLTVEVSATAIPLWSKTLVCVYSKYLGSLGIGVSITHRSMVLWNIINRLVICGIMGRIIRDVGENASCILLCGYFTDNSRIVEECWVTKSCPTSSVRMKYNVDRNIPSRKPD